MLDAAAAAADAALYKTPMRRSLSRSQRNLLLQQQLQARGPRPAFPCLSLHGTRSSLPCRFLPDDLSRPIHPGPSLPAHRSSWIPPGGFLPVDSSRSTVTIVLLYAGAGIWERSRAGGLGQMNIS